MKLKAQVINSNVVIEAYDADTGEVISIDTDMQDVVKMLVFKEASKRQKQSREDVRYQYGDKLMIFQKMVGRAYKELNGMELKTFLYLLSVMDFENYISVTQRQIALDVGISERKIKEALKGLRSKGYLEVIKKGRENFYRINPEIAWKGDEKAHMKILKGRNPMMG